MRKKLVLALGVVATLLASVTAAIPDNNLMSKRESGKTVAKVSPLKTPGNLQRTAAAKGRLQSEVPSPRKNKSMLPANHPTIYGGVIMTNDNNWSDWGIYEIPTSDEGQFIKVGRGDEGANRGGGVCAGNKYYSIRYFAFYGMEYIQAKTYDVNTWEMDDFLKILDRDLMAYDVSFDPVSEKIYGCFYSKDNDTDCWFGIADYENGTRSDIALVEKWNAFAIDKNGNAFAIDMKGDLLSVDKSTGATTKIGSTGVVPRYPTSGTIDPRSGLLYWVVCPEDQHSYLYTVDTSTAEATYVTQFADDQQVTGLYIPAPEAEEEAPAAVENVVIDFPEGSLSGNVIFTAPSTLFNGQEASGSLTYNVAGTGLEVIGGTTQFGETTKVPVTVPTAGNYEFVITVGNEVGLSPRVKRSAYIGKGIPKSTTATASYTDGKVTISWTAVTESADGGYIDPSAVTYRVIQYPGETVVAENATGTELTVSLPEPDTLTSYYFTVTPLYEENEGASSKTNSIILGQIVPPYTETFDTEDCLGAFTIIDGNEDGKLWYREGDGTMRLMYNSSEDSDDWLMTPPVRFETGYTYRITFDVRNSYGSDYPERIEVKMGDLNTVEAMTTVLLEPTDILNDSWKTYEMTFVPEHSDTYYIGFHGISKKDQFWIGIDNISISAGSSMLSPAAVSNLKATADINGLGKAEISFTTPTETLSGETLNNIDRIETYRDDAAQPFKVFENPGTGMELSCVDEDVPTGTHLYTVRVYNAQGEGKAASVATFIGINVPSSVTDVCITETSTPGQATVAWKAPEVDKDGNPINPAFIRYKLYNIEGEVVAEGYEDTSYTTVFSTPDSQEFAMMGIVATTESGESDPVYSNMIPVGRPYDSPYYDSFNENYGGIMGTTRISGYPSWAITYDNAYSNLTSQDNDNSLLVLKGDNLGDCAAAYTGKISIEKAVNPSLSLYAYKFMSENGDNDDTNTLDIQIRRADGVSEYTTIRTIVNNELDNEGWNRVLLPLEAYKGEVIQIRLVVTIKSYSVYAIDNLGVGDLPAHNLAVNNVSTPAKVSANEVFAINTTVNNAGVEDAGTFSVLLLRDGNVIDSKNIEGLGSGKHTTVEFSDSISIFGNTSTMYASRIVYDADENASDNYKEGTPVELMIPNYPTVESLSVERVGDGAMVGWDAIDLDAVTSEPITDSFEDYAPFSTKPCGDWKFVDLDGGYTFVPQDIVGDGVAYDEKLSFFVVDDRHENLNSTFAAHSGNQYLGAFYNTDSRANNDWAIAPELSGEAQTITMFAKSYNTAYGIEEFEILYSTTGNEIEDFTEKVGAYKCESEEWTEFKFDLPAGARYVAIHYISSYQYMFFIDDFTYTPTSWSKRLTLLGYNVYRDGSRLNSEIVASTNFVDEQVVSSSHVYHVTAVYDKGESAPSAPFYLIETGVEGLESSDVAVSVDVNGIIVKGAMGQHVNVCDSTGIVLYSEEASSDYLHISLNAGIYVVSVGNSNVKIAVK